jgi:hypothetical protein
MIELELCAAAVRGLNKLLELNEPTTIFREIRGILIRLGFRPRFAGARPPGLRPRSKTLSLLA